MLFWTKAQWMPWHAASMLLQTYTACSTRAAGKAQSLVSSCVNAAYNSSQNLLIPAFQKPETLLHSCYRLLKPHGVFFGISYGSAKSRMHCFLSPDFHWDTKMYTIDRKGAEIGNNGLFQNDKELVIAGPFQPKVWLYRFFNQYLLSAMHASMHKKSSCCI